MAQGSNSELLRPYTDGDYNTFIKWWGKDPPKPLSLPHLGFIYNNSAVCFVALTDCDFGILTFWCANPESKPKQMHRALTEVMRACIAASIYHAKPKVFCYTHNRAVVKILEREGFANHDGHLIGDYNG